MMNLQENIQRIKQMMGLITENIDDILDKMNQGQELSQDERDRMNDYSQHLQSGGKESNFEYQEKEKQPDTDYVYKIDDWGRLDLNTPVEQTNKIFDDMFRGMEVAEGTEKWKPWAATLSKAAGKEDEPDEQLVKWKIVFKTVSEYGTLSPVLGMYENIDTGEKEVWYVSKVVYVSRDKYQTQVENPNDEDLKQGIIFLTSNKNNGATKDAIEFGQRTFQSWAENKFNLQSGEYEFKYLDKSDRMRSVLQNIKDNIVGTL